MTEKAPARLTLKMFSFGAEIEISPTFLEFPYESSFLPPWEVCQMNYGVGAADIQDSSSQLVVE